MRTRTAKQPEIQARSQWYGTKKVLELTNETKSDRAMRELNKLFGIN